MNDPRKIRQLILISFYLVPLASLLAIALSWKKLPPRMATHFGPNGLPNGFSTPAMFAFLCLILAIVAVGVGIIVIRTIATLGGKIAVTIVALVIGLQAAVIRSEERRVGKEGRSRW